ncbi:MAG: threonine/serine exporter family protein [Oscillospiraceae bacterium]|nr:threonine/serine exporter family protein [Oscillospiraceae bacterium]
MMETVWGQLLLAFSGALGYGFLFHLPKRLFFSAAFGGLLGWGVYLLAGLCTGSGPVRYFLACILLTIYAEVMARRHKTPATLFVVPAAMPLIPGGALYYMMKYAVEQQWADAGAYGGTALSIALSIACGILTAMLAVRLFFILRGQRRG